MVTLLLSHCFLLRCKSQGKGPLMQIVYIPPVVSARWKQGQHRSSSQFTSWQQKGLPEYFSSRQTQQDALRQARYKCFSASLQNRLFSWDFTSSSGELVLNHTDGAEHITTPGTDKLLPCSCLTVIAQIHISYQWEIQGSSWCVAAVCWELDSFVFPME